MAEATSGSVETVFDTPGPNAYAEPNRPNGVPVKTTVDDLLSAYDEDAKTAEEVEVKEEKAPPAKARGKEENLLNKAAETVKEAEKEANEELKAKKETEEQAKKAYKAQHNDLEIEIPEEAVIPQEINGKEVPVKVKDAVKAFVAQEEFNRAANARVHQITHRERAHADEVGKIQNYFKQIVDTANQGDFTAAMKVVAEMAGQDPVDYEQKQLEQLSEVFCLVLFLLLRFSLELFRSACIALGA